MIPSTVRRTASVVSLKRRDFRLMGRAFAMAGLAALVACDPGWFYQVPGGSAEQGENGLWYTVAGPGDTKLRVHANVFSLGLTARLEITNLSPATLTVRPALLEAHAGGARLSLNDSVPNLWCKGMVDPVSVALDKGESCLLYAMYTITPDPVELEHITLSFDGLSRESANIPLRVALERIPDR